jgi:hypothetical protein
MAASMMAAQRRTIVSEGRRASIQPRWRAKSEPKMKTAGLRLSAGRT